MAAVPGMQTAMFSILAAGKHIPDHNGPYKGVIRYHLGLKVPRAADRCRIRVGDTIATWREGASLIFDDTYEHEVWNDTDEERVVLFLDIVRPLRFPMNVVNGSSCKAIATHRSSVAGREAAGTSPCGAPPAFARDTARLGVARCAPARSDASRERRAGGGRELAARRPGDEAGRRTSSTTSTGSPASVSAARAESTASPARSVQRDSASTTTRSSRRDHVSANATTRSGSRPSTPASASSKSEAGRRTAPAVDHLLRAPEDHELPVDDHAGVAGVEPAVDDRRRGGGRIVEIAVHQRRAAHHHLARRGAADINARQRRAARHRGVRLEVDDAERARRRHRGDPDRRLGEPVARRDRAPARARAARTRR